MPLPDNDPRVAAALAAPLVSEDHGTGAGHGALLVHRTEHSGLRVAAAMDHLVDGPDSTDVLQRVRPRHGTGHRDRRPPARPAPADPEAADLRLVERPVPPGAVGPGGGGHDRGPAHRLGRPAGRATPVPGHVLGPDGRRTRRRPADRARRPLRPVPRPPGQRPGRAARHSGQGADRHRLRRARLLGHRDLRAARAHLEPPRGRPRRPPVAPLHPPRRQGESRRPRAHGPPFPGGRSPARSAPPTGRPARPPSTSTPTSPTPSSATSTPPRTRSSKPTQGWNCWWRPPGCGARSATTTATAGSACPA